MQHVLHVIDEKPGVDRQLSRVFKCAGRNAHGVHPHPIERFISSIRINLVTHELEGIHVNMERVHQLEGELRLFVLQRPLLRCVQRHRDIDPVGVIELPIDVESLLSG